LIWRVKLITIVTIIIIIIIIINLGQASPSRPKKLGPEKGRLIQGVWVWLERRPKSLGYCSHAWPKTIGHLSGSNLLGPTSGSNANWILFLDSMLLNIASGSNFFGQHHDPMHLDPVSRPNVNGSCIRA
jgi:hypothetical protein